MTEEKQQISSQYLTFNLGEEVFALEISQVREILEWMPTTKLPQSPDDMHGVINVRDKVVPVIDLRIKFGMEAAEKSVDTCIVITEIPVGDGFVVLGALADAVREVVELDGSQIEPPPAMGTLLDTRFIKGIGKRDEHFIIILDSERLFDTEELAMAQSSEIEVDVVNA
jgi:purine-binding chemotaxis protein CheW